MVSFTTLLNRAHRQFIDKYLKKRYCGECEGCGRRTLLVKLVNDECEWELCEWCYDKLIKEEIKE